MKKFKGWLIAIAIFFALGIIGSFIKDEPAPPVDSTEITYDNEDIVTGHDIESTSTNISDTASNPDVKEESKKDYIPELASPKFDVSLIPDYSGKPYTPINDNVPYFSESEYTTTAFEKYSPLDSLGRCGVAWANVCVDIMPTEERGSIGSVKPSGWQTIKYENVDGKYLYNRCHLIGFQLSGENANEQNLITGTRYMNVNGMLPFENMVADYVKETNNHVLYRVTPIFKGDNLLATGVLMEAYSIEDNGDGICFNVFCYNEQPGIEIDHATGESKSANGDAPYGSSATTSTATKTEADSNSNAEISKSDLTPEFTHSYIANKNTRKFHYPSCNSVKRINESNKVYLKCTRDDAVSQGYSPCGNCNP